MVKEPACNAGDLGLIPALVGKIPWKRECLPTPVFLAGESWTEEPGRLQSVGHNESDTTEQLTHTRICIHIAESLCCTPETNTTLSINYT